MASSSSSSASRRGFAMDVIGQSSGSASTSHAASQSRPTGRPAAFRDEEGDDDDDDGFQRLHNGSSSRNGPERRSRDEMLTGYSKSRGAEKAQRSPPRVSNGPRVITKQSDLNWMEERKRRLGLGRHREDLGRLTSMRMPGKGDDVGGTASASGKVEKEDVVKDRIGDEKQLSGLQIQKRERGRQEEEELEEIRWLQEAAAAKLEDEGEDVTPSASQTGPSPVMGAKGGVDEDDEAAARAALLSGQGLGGGSAFRSEHEERIIPISEEDALKRDTESRPEAPTMSDYAKMPVEEFGAALLRGMGWKEGTGAGKNRQGPTSAPEVKKRAALLGLGAKERQLHNDSSASDNVRNGSKKNFRVERPERRYIPVIKREREIANGDRHSSTASPPPPSSHRDRERHREIERDRERPRERERDRDRPRERSRSPADRHERRRRGGEEEGYDRRRDDEHHSRSDRAYDEDHDRRKRERERDRDYDRDRHSRHSRR